MTYEICDAILSLSYQQLINRGVYIMTFDNVVTAISSVGFPIVVSLYMITTVNKTLDGLKDAIDKLTYIVTEKMLKDENK